MRVVMGVEWCVGGCEWYGGLGSGMGGGVW